MSNTTSMINDIHDLEQKARKAYVSNHDNYNIYKDKIKKMFQKLFLVNQINTDYRGHNWQVDGFQTSPFEDTVEARKADNHVRVR